MRALLCEIAFDFVFVSDWAQANDANEKLRGEFGRSKAAVTALEARLAESDERLKKGAREAVIVLALCF